MWILQLTTPPINSRLPKQNSCSKNKFWKEIYRILDEYPSVRLLNGHDIVARLSGRKEELAEINTQARKLHTQKFHPIRYTG